MLFIIVFFDLMFDITRAGARLVLGLEFHNLSPDHQLKQDFINSLENALASLQMYPAAQVSVLTARVAPCCTGWCIKSLPLLCASEQYLHMI